MRGVVWCRLLVASALMLRGGGPLLATVVVPNTFQEIVADASLIVRGRVTDVRAVSTLDRGIESVATVAVDSVLKGPAESFVYVRVPGGEQGRTRVVMVGAPALRAGMSAVFFLARAGGDNAWRPVGLMSGVAPIVRDATGRAIVRAPVLATRDTAGRVIRGDSSRRDLGVADFESLVMLVSVDRRAIPRPRP